LLYERIGDDFCLLVWLSIKIRLKLIYQQSQLSRAMLYYTSRSKIA